MKKIKCINTVLIVFIVVIFISCNNGNSGNNSENEEWDYNGPGPSDPPNVVMNKYDTDIKAVVDSSDYITLNKLATVQVDDFAGNIYSVIIEPKTSVERTVFISGGIHGDEIVTTAGIIKFIEKLKNDPDLYPGTRFEIIPIVNPWGICHGTRRNHNNIDLNRDFVNFSQLESQTVRDFVDNKQYDIVLNHHGMWNRGFMMFRFWGATPTTGDKVITAIRNNGFTILSNSQYGIVNGINDVPSSDPVHSMDRFMRWNNSENVYVLETFSYNDESVIDRGIDIQEIALDEFMKSLY